MKLQHAKRGVRHICALPVDYSVSLYQGLTFLPFQRTRWTTLYKSVLYLTQSRHNRCLNQVCRKSVQEGKARREASLFSLSGFNPNPESSFQLSSFSEKQKLQGIYLYILYVLSCTTGFLGAPACKMAALGLIIHNCRVNSSKLILGCKLEPETRSGEYPGLSPKAWELRELMVKIISPRARDNISHQSGKEIPASPAFCSVHVLSGLDDAQLIEEGHLLYWAPLVLQW